MSSTPEIRSRLIPSKETNTTPSVADKSMNALETYNIEYAESNGIWAGRRMFGSESPQAAPRMNIDNNGHKIFIRLEKIFL